MSDIRERFIGTWSLVSWFMEDQDGKRSFPFGVDASGYIIYTAGGLMSAMLMEQRRPALGLPSAQAREIKVLLATQGEEAIGPEHLPTLIRYFQASAGYLSYSGAFDVVGDTIVHHLDNSLYPEWVGTDLVRRFVFRDDTLLLCADAGPLTAHLLWRRQQQA